LLVAADAGEALHATKQMPQAAQRPYPMKRKNRTCQQPGDPGVEIEEQASMVAIAENATRVEAPKAPKRWEKCPSP